ncbi:unnamed protein product [Ceutorhynchus assimilis]|uniref:Uncharacterized protein n=1 Tax=Ceutorhynchus assimilis TaxID=467358 RepID=A0A9N9QPZ7_9CUCU|nr:unnamed protein product [Ceutorhynchus assimilis]
MFAKIVVFSGLLAIVLSAPAEPEPVPIISQNSDIQPDGSFKWDFESADGTKQEQSGAIKAGAEPDETVSAVAGSVSWTDPDGQKHELNYVADENGFQPQGADVPVAPEIPAQIARALEWIANHPEPEEPAKQ